MKIIGTGSAYPQTVVSNKDLEKIMDTSDEWIRSRTGIEVRRIAKEESCLSMSIEAANRAMEAAGIGAEELDLIIVASLSTDYVVPMLSCQLQAAIGAHRAVAFDINAACSGFVFALSTADAYLRTGRFHKALVMGTEILSKLMDWSDRETCVLFGDGSGAAVISDEEDRLLGFIQGSDGRLGMSIACENRISTNPFMPDPPQQKLDYVRMDGREVYRFAVRTEPKVISEMLAQAGLTPDDADLYFLHQANLRIIQAVAKRLKQPMEKFPVSIQEFGNTSSASVPMLLDREVRAGSVHKGDRIVLSGFGGGLTWGACALEW